MRISDWGSDVCSSDLRLKGADGSRAFDRESLFLRYGSLSRGDGEGRGLPEPADPEGELNRLRYGLRGHNAFAFTVALPHHVHSGIAGRNWVANGPLRLAIDRQSGGTGKSVSVRVDVGGRSIIKKKKIKR